MANFTTNLDLKKSILHKCGELQDGTSSFDTIAKEYMVAIYQSMLSGSSEFDIDLGEPWIWAKARHPSVLNLEVAYETGDIDLTNGSTSGTFNTAPAASQEGRYLKVSERPEYFRIASHTAGAGAFTIDANYTGATISGASFKSIPLEYDLASGVQRLIDGFSIYKSQGVDSDTDQKVFEVDLATLKSDYPLTELEQGIPNRFAQVHDRDGTIRIRVNRFPSSETRLEYDFIPVPNDLPIAEFLDAAVDTGTDTITSAAHGFSDDDIVIFTSTGTVPAGLTANQKYFIVGSTSNTFQVSTSVGGAALNITAAAGTGTHTASGIPLIPREAVKAIVYGSTYWLMLDKNDDRSQSYLLLAQAKMRSLIEANRKEMTQSSKDKGRVIPRPEQMRRVLFRNNNSS